MTRDEAEKLVDDLIQAVRDDEKDSWTGGYSRRYTAAEVVAERTKVIEKLLYIHQPTEGQ